MGLADIIRAGVAIADTVTKGAQVDITLYAWTAQDVHGKPSYASPVTLKAIVDYTRKQRYLDSRMVTVAATVTILTPVTPNGAAGRHEPIDVRDRIILPDGTSGPILLAPSSVWDAGAGRPFINEVFIGEPGQIV